MEYIWALSSYFLFNSFINFIDTMDYSPCTNKSLENDFPVVSFCKESTVVNGAIVLDGYYAHSNTDVTTCTCVARGQNGQRIVFSNPNFFPAVVTGGCASELKVSNGNIAFTMSCHNQGSLVFVNNGDISIVLTKQQTTADTRYCIFVDRADISSSSFSITCEGNSANVTETPTSVQTTPTHTSLTTVPNGLPPQTTTTHVSVSSSTVSDDKDLGTSTLGVTSSPQKDNEMLYIGVGAGCGAGLVIIIVVLTVVICKSAHCRRSKTKTEENRRSDKDEDNDELPYNVLYVSADANSIDDNHRNSVNKAMDNTTHDIEGNYSTVDVEDQPVKTTASTNPVKPAIAPKPKSKENGKTSIKYVTAPGEEGVEYAVVDKQGNVSSVEQDKVTPSMADNTYAVVNKERKRKPGDNNTNKIKNQTCRSIKLSSDEYRDQNRSATKDTTSSEEQHLQYSGEGQQALKKNSNNLLFSESTNYAEIDLPE